MAEAPSHRSSWDRAISESYRRLSAPARQPGHRRTPKLKSSHKRGRAVGQRKLRLPGQGAAIDRDDANSYLPFQGHLALREAACAHVAAITGRSYDPGTQCVSVAGGLNGILNVLLATVEPGQEVMICNPVYAGWSTESASRAVYPGSCPAPPARADGPPTRRCASAR